MSKIMLILSVFSMHNLSSYKLVKICSFSLLPVLIDLVKKLSLCNKIGFRNIYLKTSDLLSTSESAAATKFRSGRWSEISTSLT